MSLDSSKGINKLYCKWRSLAKIMQVLFYKKENYEGEGAVFISIL